MVIGLISARIYLTLLNDYLAFFYMPIVGDKYSLNNKRLFTIVKTAKMFKNEFALLKNLI